MSRIRAKGNKSTELRFARLLRAMAISGWRRHVALPGKPDFYFRTVKLAIFVDGCFWHACPKCKFTPKNNGAFWKKKLEGNRKRDKVVFRLLKSRGIDVLRIWEHELKEKDTSRIRKTLEMRLAERTIRDLKV